MRLFGFAKDAARQGDHDERMRDALFGASDDATRCSARRTPPGWTTARLARLGDHRVTGVTALGDGSTRRVAEGFEPYAATWSLESAQSAKTHI
jgi:hypothetical protein